MDENGEQTVVENPEAENIKHLPGGYGYYWNLLLTDEDNFERAAMNLWGSSTDGLPVFKKEYNELKHNTKETIPVSPSSPLLMGVDWGLRDSGYVFAQLINSTLVIHDELLISDEPLETQLSEYVIPLITSKYQHLPGIQVWADPYGLNRDGIFGVRVRDHFHKVMGVEPKETSNVLAPRLDAVRTFLKKDVGLIMNVGVTQLRKGLRSKYVFKRKRVTGAAADYKSEPDKSSKYSHIVDALQYLCLGLLTTSDDDAADVAPQDFDTTYSV
jgi:hypothetical protein